MSNTCRKLNCDCCDKDDYKKLLEKYSNIDYMFGIAECYEKGLGVEKDEKIALYYYDGVDTNMYSFNYNEKDRRKIFEKHLQLNNLYRIAECYEKGFGVEKDEKKALEYYKKILENKVLDKIDIITVHIRHLYHSTRLITENTPQEDNPYNIPIGSFSRDLSNPKYFILHELMNYYADYDCPYVLKYTCKRPLTLLDIRSIREILRNREINDYIDAYVKVHNLDGYIEDQDSYEICLFNPKDCVYEEFEQLSYYADCYLFHEIHKLCKDYIDNNKTISDYKHYLDSSVVFNRPSLPKKIWTINDLLTIHN